MFPAPRLRLPGSSFCLSLCLLFTLALAALPPRTMRGDEKRFADPWLTSQAMQPADLAKELTGKSSSLPTVVFIGFRSLYVGGHIPGASFHGTASTKEGLAELKTWAATLPRSTDLIIYCGCCPFDKCPNIRPAYTALSSMGFKKLRVLVIPKDFATDWADKGYPMEKGM